MTKAGTEDSQIAEAEYLDGQFLVAMPLMTDKRFARSVVYLCAHTEDGAMGLIINQPAPNVSSADLLQRLDIHPSKQSDAASPSNGLQALPIQFGGPVETGRGFVLHSPDYFVEDSTLEIQPEVSLTATVEVLTAIADGVGPKRALLALGYAGWAPGQLEAEIQENGWLVCPADPEIVFDDDIATKYVRTLGLLGIDLSHLVSDAGHC